MPIEEQLSNEFLKLKVNQLTYLAWRCAVYSLPFLALEKEFWNDGKTQKNLLMIFEALDIAKAISLRSVNEKRVYNYDDDILNLVRQFENSKYPLSTIAWASHTAFNMNADMHTVVYSSTIHTINLLSKIKEFGPVLKQLILKEINDLQGSKITQVSKYLSSGFNHIILDSFLEELRHVGCEYWAILYQGLYSNNFELDLAVLERRLNLPEEIRVQGAAAVAEYLTKLEIEGSEHLNEARIIILGEKGVGKTCIARRLIDPNAPMTTPEESTAGVDTSLWKLAKENINVKIWDFAGHTVTHAVHQFFLSERCLYIMVYDGRSEDRNRLEYWLEHMKNYGRNSEAVILVNERDKHSVDIPINYLREEYPIAGFYSFNVEKDSKELKSFREFVANYIKNNPSWKKQEIPKSYFEVKKELEKRFNKDSDDNGQELLSKSIFLEIAKNYKVTEPEKLLQDLHFLGVSLWYKSMTKYRTLILNPEWISHGIYKIINWVSNEKSHNITLDEFSNIFKDDLKRFPKDKHEFLFDLLIQFELAYEVSKEKRLIIPHLLKEDQPSKLPVFNNEESLMMRFEADQPLPPNTISRFIIRHNDQIKKENGKFLVWKYGVILIDRKAGLAMVREKDRTISISVSGKEKSNFISKLRETLNEILESYASKHPKLRYKIIDNSLNPTQEIWLPELEIAMLDQRNKPYFDYRSGVNIPMHPTIVQYKIDNFIVKVNDGSSFVLGSQSTQSTTNIFNFHDCNIEMQGKLNELVYDLNKNGNKEEAEEIEEVIDILDKIDKDDNPESIKKKGVVNKLKRLIENLGDENSTIHKTIKGIKNGVSIAQEIAQEYNKIAEWLLWPQVPKPFLKKDNP